MTQPAHTMRAIDCDVHPALPSLNDLVPYLPEVWQELVANRGIHDLESISYLVNSPLTARPDWRPSDGKPGHSLDMLRSQALDAFGSSIAICNCLYGIQLLFSEDMASTFATALNKWMAREWLDREPRLRASIVVAPQNPEMAAAEIERCSEDARFVQVLMLLLGEMPLGKRYYWPIYAAAEKHGLPIAIHAGSSYKHPVTAVGWPSYHVEDYVAQALGFQTQLTSLICEGVFTKFPDLRAVLLESGFTWLPAYLWRLDKAWKGLRMEVPWLDRSPTEIVKSNVRLTIQPVDAPPTQEQFERALKHMAFDELLLFSTDYPHWHYDGTNALPASLSADATIVQKILVGNALATYPRLGRALQ